MYMIILSAIYSLSLGSVCNSESAKNYAEQFDLTKKQPNFSQKCDSIKLLNSLIKEVLNKRYVYQFQREDTARAHLFLLDPPNYINLNNINSTLFYNKVIPTNTIRYDTLNTGMIYFDTINFKNNISNLDIVVSFFSMGSATSTTKFEYLIDTLNCNWKLKDSTMNVY